MAGDGHRLCRVYPRFGLQKGPEELLSSLTFLSWPELAVIGASVCSGYGCILLRLLVKNQSIPILMVNGLSMLMGGLLALVHSFLVDTWAPLPVAKGNLGAFSQGLFIIIFISNILCYNLYGLLLKRFTATFLSFMGLLFPIFASFNSWLFLGEPFFAHDPPFHRDRLDRPLAVLQRRIAPRLYSKSPKGLKSGHYLTVPLFNFSRAFRYGLNSYCSVLAQIRMR